MSSLYLCCDCPSSFASLVELQQHEMVEHAMVKQQSTTPLSHQQLLLESISSEQIKMDYDQIKMEYDQIKMEDDLSDTDSSNISLNPTTPTEGKGRYECEDCHEMFAVKRELATHMRIHSGEQPHQCTQCGKEFGTRQLLKKHWMWHTGQRSHVCPHCNKAFFQKGHLTQHLMIHSGGRPHECPQCHKTFIFKFDLNRHMKIHQERGYSCQQCGRSFLKQIMLDEHHLKCKGKPSSPNRSVLTPTVKPEPAKREGLVLTSDQIAKMAQTLFLQQRVKQEQQQLQQQKSAFSSLLIKQENNNVDFSANLAVPTIPLNCMICNTGFPNQSSWALHMYMYHFSNQATPNKLTVDSTIQSTDTNSSSDADPGTDTSCASSPQKVSPLQHLESCLEQSSVSPGSSSSSGPSPQPTASEASVASCKDCTLSWQRVQELELQMAKKGAEFQQYRQMMRMVIENATNLLTQSADNVFVNHATQIFKQLQNTL